MDELDWEWVASFVAVSDHGSMRAAADATGISQPTLSRHVARLEEALRLPLFDRRGRGLALTPRGTQLYESAAAVRASMDAFRRQAMGLGEQVAGTARVTASWHMGLALLPRWLARFREVAPHVTVDLVLEDTETNLLTREAEVAVRQFRPRQLDLVSRHCGDTRLGFYASPAYLAGRGIPRTLEDLRDHDMIGFDRITVALEMAAQMGFPLHRESYAFRSDSLSAQVAAARAGLGVVATGTWDVDGLVRVLPEHTLPGQEVWVVAHPEIHRNPRVRAVWRDLAEFLTEALEVRPEDGGLLRTAGPPP